MSTVEDQDRIPVCASLLTTYADCQRRAYFRHVKRIEHRMRPESKGAALAWGTLVHAALGRFMTSGVCSTSGAVSAAVATLGEIDARLANTFLSADEEEQIKILREALPGLMEAFFLANERWLQTGPMSAHAVCTAEEVLTSTSDPNLKVLGRVDLLWSPAKPPAVTHIVDYKTRAIISDLSLKTLEIDFQVGTYAYLIRNAMLHDNTPADFTFLFLRKPLLRRKATESLTEFGKRLSNDFHDRPDTYFTSYVLRLFGSYRERRLVRMVLSTANSYARKLRAGGASHIQRWLQNPGACTSGYTHLCEYFDLCAHGLRKMADYQDRPPAEPGTL